MEAWILLAALVFVVLCVMLRRSIGVALAEAFTGSVLECIKVIIGLILLLLWLWYLA